MAYIGREPLSGDFRKIDSIESQFNSNTNTFAITYQTTAVVPGSPYVMIAVLDGQVLEPAVDYNVNGNNLIFTNAPNAAQSFHAIILGNTGSAVISGGGGGIASINGLTGNNLTLNNVTINASVVSNVTLSNVSGNLANITVSNATLTNSVLGSNVSGIFSNGTINHSIITNSILGSNVAGSYTGSFNNSVITNSVLFGSNVSGTFSNGTTNHGVITNSVLFGSNVSGTFSNGTTNHGVITNTVLGGNVSGTLSDTALSNAYVSSYKELITNLGNVSGTVSVNLTQGNIYRANLIGNTTFTFTNPPAMPFTMPITLIVTQMFGANTINVTSAVYTENALPQLSTAGGNTDVLTFFSPNGGVRYIGTHAIADVII